MLRTVAATRYVTPFREGGSLPGLCEADDDGLYVVKFHGAGQGPKALVAEVIVGELARALGLPVPELVLVELDARLAAGEPHWEVKELLDRSPGTNLGVDFLPGALGFAPAVGPAPEPELAAAFVWLDALTLNVDRTPRNPNLLVWHRRLYGIDHGAALYMQHRWEDALGDAEHARRPFAQVRDHVLLPFAGSLVDADARLAPRVTDSAAARAGGRGPGGLAEGRPGVCVGGRQSGGVRRLPAAAAGRTAGVRGGGRACPHRRLSPPATPSPTRSCASCRAWTAARR